MANWTHDPPCPEGGYTEVSPNVMRMGYGQEYCPLCGAVLTPPAEVADARRRRAEADRQAYENWDPPTPQQIIAMAQTGKTLDEVRAAGS